ncbi:ATPase [Algimonas ampicilliniresistens]|uniref:histidine kinase n=1 Tax=Algimonas ampicilliniresistens TaxID=1298735 RepID=A0ABQ5VCA8_9PROT|nr:HAMP domain-containing sensor histidine kinase [Algimonas ampicilliniresistens]GLQ24428.1 ATPase [Algimonas ampicilliniresistens]
MRRFFSRSLSARLLLLTFGFVLMAETLLFVPSIAFFRQEGLEMRARSAGLIAEALMNQTSEDPSREASEMLAQQFMMQTDADFLAAFQDGQTLLILGDPPQARIIATADLRNQGRLPNFFATAMDFFARGDGYLRLIVASPIAGQDRLEMLVPCAAIGADLRAYAGRILLLSLLIAAFVGALIYLSMLRLIVRPVQRLADDMTAFREAPERRRRAGPPSDRGDEIGQLQREFHEVKQSLRSAFRQRERLASLGLSVTKINHDLRNVLSTALLMADRLSMHEDPKLAEMGERLTRTVERGVGLTEEVLEYSSAREPEPVLEPVQLGRIVAEVQVDLRVAFPRVWIGNRIGRDVWISADPEQLHRILSNLTRNAAQAMTGQSNGRVEFSTEIMADTVITRIQDNGPGLPDSVEDRLFLPFTRGHSEGSTGLGLSISKELAERMGGSLELLETGPDGTTFILGLPLTEDPTQS